MSNIVFKEAMRRVNVFTVSGRSTFDASDSIWRQFPSSLRSGLQQSSIDSNRPLDTLICQLETLDAFLVMKNNNDVS